MQETSVVVLDQQLGTISPRLYGHFAEHLGRCCYGGLWADGAVPNVDGFRPQVVAALKELGVPLVRWPGGCYADHYHWRNGIGAPADRPRTLGTSCGLRVAESNALGTHEFLRLCELLGAEPYLALNVGSGTVQEACDWVEYVNGAAPTALVMERRANGRSEPWAVRLWGVGNETWDCGGRFDAVTYAHEFLRFASMIRHVDPQVELIAVGMEDGPLPESGLDGEWNRKLLGALGSGIGLLNHLSVHRYWTRGGPETDFSEEEYYALLDEAASTEDLIERTAETISAFPGSGHVRIALAQRGVWHPEARDWGPGNAELRRTPVTFEQANTMRDAMAAGIALEGFHRQCRILSMANLAQVVNVLQSVLITEGETCVRTPTYHAFALHRPHMAAQALAVEVTGGSSHDGRPSTSATASAKGGSTAVTLLNRDIRNPAEITLQAPGQTGKGVILSAPAANAANSPAEPDAVAPRPLTVEPAGKGRWKVLLPPCSMATIEFALGSGGS